MMEAPISGNRGACVRERRSPTAAEPKSPNRLSRFGLSCALAIQLGAFSLAAPFDMAYAEVLKADVIAGSTVEERQLSFAECPSISASYAVLTTEDGQAYFNRNGDDETQIASITKVMTAIVALDHADTSLEVTVSQEAAEIGESSANLQEGDRMDLAAALRALLVPSGNDAAISIAEAVGKEIIKQDPSKGDDPQSAFVAAMNDKASFLGLTGTIYENPHGLDDGEFDGDLCSTALDQAKVASYAMDYPEIREIVGGGSTVIQVYRDGKKENVELETTDLLLEMYDYAIGVKTGVTDLAGPSFMGAATKDGRELYAIVLDSDDEYARFEDARTLFEWGYDHFIDLPLANTNEWTTMRLDGSSSDVPVIAEVSHYEWIDRTVKATLSDPDATVNVFDLEGNVSQSVELDELHGTVAAGDKVGTIRFLQRNEVIAEQDLIACERVEAPNPLDTIAVWWQRLTRGLDDTTGRAQSKIYNVMPIIDDNTTNAA